MSRHSEKELERLERLMETMNVDSLAKGSLAEPDGSARARRCIICGARVRNMNQKADTCSPECTAKKHGKEVPIHFRRCHICQSPIADDATSCESCGTTDFET